MKKYVLFLALAALLLAGCAPNNHPATPAGGAGFFQGIWHGFIVLFTFVVSLFNDNVGIYETMNSGKLYDLGFVLGLMIFWGGGGGSAVCGRKKC